MMRTTILKAAREAEAQEVVQQRRLRFDKLDEDEEDLQRHKAAHVACLQSTVSCVRAKYVHVSRRGTISRHHSK